MVSQNWMRLRSRPMSCEQALIAIYAARHRNQWGRWATVRWHATEDGSVGKGTGRHIACFVLDGAKEASNRLK